MSMWRTGVYGYFGAEQLDLRKVTTGAGAHRPSSVPQVKVYLVWITLVVLLNAGFLGAGERNLRCTKTMMRVVAGLYMSDSFCAEHNCEKATEGYCVRTVCAVIEVRLVGL